jgi:hypothetical protein
MARLHPKMTLVASFAASSALAWSPAVAQTTTTEDAKAQADLRAAQLANTKALQDMIAANKQATEGKATLESIEAGAEGLRLKHIVEQQLAVKIGSAIGNGEGRPIILVFGDRPPTTAHYLSILHFREELRLNTDRALELARNYYTPKPKPSRRLHTYRELSMSLGGGGFLGSASTALTGVSTLVSLLRVDTELKGAALTMAAESLGPIVAERLAKSGWQVTTRSGIAKDTPFANELVKELRPGRDEAAGYYQKYVSDLTAKGGKAEDLPSDERIVGAALATVIGDYATLIDGLFTPAEGVLPATVVEDERALATASAGQRILYVQGQEAGLTSITKKGFLTGLGGSVPAYVSASINASYAFIGGEAPKFGSISYQTPIMRVTSVTGWADSAEAAFEAWPKAVPTTVSGR